MARRRVKKWIHPDYAAALNRVIRDLAREKGKTEEWVRRAGQRELANKCREIDLPLFCCRKG